MKLSRTIAYGVHAAIQLARATDGSPTPASQLAREGQLPERFLVQILRFLVTNGVLRSTCGVAGGYVLSRPAAQITLREIVESFDNPMQVYLPDLEGMTPGVRTLVVSSLDEASAAARAMLQKVTLADLLRAATDKPTAVRNIAPAPIGINIHHLIESNDYETQTSDSPATR